MKKYACLALITIAAAGFASAHAENVEFPIPLPKVYYSGTPCDYLGKNLDFNAGIKDPAPLAAPQGTTNVALNKPVTASAEPNFGELSYVTDGQNTHEEKVLMELGPGLQWVQIDLEKPCDIYGVAFWHSYGVERVYFDTIVQVANDPEFKKDVTTIYNADYDNSAGQGIGTDKEYKENYRGRVAAIPEGVTGRYVRLYCSGNDADNMSRYIEVQVFGVPAR